MKLLRRLLIPIVPVYYIVTWLRNKFYDYGIFKSITYEIPLIAVGNLSVGGTGKTPMIEYLIRLLGSEFRVATLSRGYKRQSSGFVLADPAATASQIGDEPFQFYKKFPNIKVSVDADRRRGISNLLQLKDKPQVILLDDAYQHRKVKAGFYILLTAFDHLYANDILLPTGNLREPRQGANRAQAIVVTKCPPDLNGNQKQNIIENLKPLSHQPVFFSSISYAQQISNGIDHKDLEFLKSKTFSLVTGIANAQPLIDFLKSKDLKFEHLNFPDHHEFNDTELKTLQKKSFILTTEKDFVRLEPEFSDVKKLFYLPIAITLDRPEAFNDLVKTYVNLNKLS